MSGSAESVLRKPVSTRPTTFKPGQNVNPGGRRPKDYKSFSLKLHTRDDATLEAIDDALAERPVTTQTMRAIELVWAYRFGKPPTIVKIEGDVEIRISEDLRKARARMAELGREILDGVVEAVVEDEEQP